MTFFRSTWCCVKKMIGQIETDFFDSKSQESLNIESEHNVYLSAGKTLLSVKVSFEM
jgi:hypothetical protein